MEGTEPMAVDDASPQSAEEHPDVSNVSNRYIKAFFDGFTIFWKPELKSLKRV